jgi:hypothetical protein
MKKENRREPRKAMGRQGRSLIPFAIAIVVVLGLVFGGWGTVYAAQDSGPDDFLYPVKVAVDYLASVTAEAISLDEAPVPPQAISIQKQDRDLLQGMTKDNDAPKHMYRKGYESPDAEAISEPLLDNLDLPIDDTLVTTPTITGTQTMSGSLWGPGPCLGGPENCELDLTAPHGYTYTHGVDDEAPFQGTPPVTDPVPSLGPGESPVKEVQEPAGNTGTTGGQKKGGK